MRVILMAAGYGARISRNINCPKSVLEIEDTNIIRHSVELFLEKNIKVAVVVGYKRKAIFKALKGLDVTFYYNPFFKVTNSLASLWFARDFISLDEDLILGNADLYWEGDLLQKLIDEKYPAVMLGDKTKIETGDYFFKVKSGYIEKYGKNLTLEERSCEYVGLGKFTTEYIKQGLIKRIDDLVWKEGYTMWWENVCYNYIAEYPVKVLDVDGVFWSEIDYIEDYERILKHIEESKLV